MLPTIAILLAVLLFAYFRSKRSSITLEEISSGLKQGGILVDVRTLPEYQQGHATGAKNIPLAKLQSGSLPPVSQDKPVYVYCHSGARASSARMILRKKGFTQVVNIGGLAKWRALGGSVIQ